MESSLSWELALPKHFEAVAELVTEEAVAKEIVCGPDPAGYMAAIGKYVDAGFDHLSFHQVGPDQEGFFEFFTREIRPALQTGRSGRKTQATRRSGRGRKAA
jgi:hypothetical protein